MKTLIAFLSLSAISFAATKTEEIGFRGRKGWTALATVEYYTPSPEVITEEENSEAPWGLKYIQNITFQAWRPDGSPVWASDYPSVKDGAAHYGYLNFRYNTLRHEVVSMDVGGFSGEYDPSKPYQPSAYLYSNAAYLGKNFGRLLDDNIDPEIDPSGWKLDEGKIRVGGIPTHTPETSSSLALGLLGLGVLAILRRRA